MQPLSPGPQMMAYIAARGTLSKAEHACGLLDSAAAGVSLTLPLRLRYGIYRDVLAELDIIAAFAVERGDTAKAARLYGGIHALRLRSLHVARPYASTLHTSTQDQARAQHSGEWSRGTTLTLVQLINEAQDYLKSAGFSA